jgi:tRNA dimethylallyltransferase
MQAAAPPTAAILFGATATCKTALAVQVAAHVPVEVISADSRQVYRQLDVGTAKPTEEERRAVPHHLVDFLDLECSYTAARFAADTRRLCGEIRARGRVPLIVGGAGFYLKVLREGLFDAPYSDAELQEVRREVLGWTTDAIRKELAVRDPERLAAIHPNDRYRLSRALEICIASGSSVTALTAARPAPAHSFVEGRIQIARDTLHRRIAIRTEQMLQGGWIEEVRTLLEQGGDPTSPGFESLGYPHVVEHVQGKLDLERCAELVNRDTRRFARHQETWFRKTQATTLSAGDARNAALLAARIQPLVPA